MHSASTVLLSRAKPVLLMVLLALGGAAFAEDRTALQRIERDLASVDTAVRAAAVEALVALREPREELARILRVASRDPAQGLREIALSRLGTASLRHERDAVEAFFDALEDPDMRIARMARERIVALDLDGIRHVPLDRLASVLGRAREEGDRFHMIQIVETVLESGARFPVGPLLDAAVATVNSRVRDRALGTALRAATVAPIETSDLPALNRLLRADDETRFAAVQIAAKSLGVVCVPLLLEVEAGGSEQERTFAWTSLDARRSEPALRRALEDVAATSSDARVRERAKARLEGR